MANKGCKQRKVAFRYPKHAMSPEDLLYFIETSEFTAAWEKLGLNDEDDLLALQLCIMAGPKRAPVIRGTGGLRKLRFAPADWGTGTRGAARICYVYFEEYGIVLLVLAYAKNEKDDLSESERSAIKQYIYKAKRELDRLKKIR
jgi:hypothetical protein